AATSIPAERLPFVGELIQVRDSERAWEGAIERVMHNFALSLLVDNDDYARVTEWVNRTNLKGRLVFYRLATPAHRADLTQVGDTSLVRKLMLKEDSTAYDWLLAQLVRRFNYTCCDSLEEFRKLPTALTAAGQVKSGGDRHEKDDRHGIQDRSRFVLGWDSRPKV